MREALFALLNEVVFFISSETNQIVYHSPNVQSSFPKADLNNLASQFQPTIQQIMPQIESQLLTQGYTQLQQSPVITFRGNFAQSACEFRIVRDQEGYVLVLEKLHFDKHFSRLPLHQENKLISSTFYSPLVANLIIGSRGEIISANQVGLSLLGDCTEANLSQFNLTNLHDCIKDESDVSLHFDWIRSSGGSVVYQTDGLGISMVVSAFESEHEPTCYFFQILPKTTEHALILRSEILRHIVQSLGLNLLVISANGIVLDVSTEASLAMGMARRDVINKPIIDLMIDADGCQKADFRTALNEAEKELLGIRYNTGQPPNTQANGIFTETRTGPQYTNMAFINGVQIRNVRVFPLVVKEMCVYVLVYPPTTQSKAPGIQQHNTSTKRTLALHKYPEETMDFQIDQDIGFFDGFPCVVVLHNTDGVLLKMHASEEMGLPSINILGDYIDNGFNVDPMEVRNITEVDVSLTALSRKTKERGWTRFEELKDELEQNGKSTFQCVLKTINGLVSFEAWSRLIFEGDHPLISTFYVSRESVSDAFSLSTVLGSALDAITEPMFVVDHLGRTYYCNRNGLSMISVLSLDQIVNKPFNDLLSFYGSSCDFSTFQQFADAVRVNNTIKLSVTYSHKQYDAFSTMTHVHDREYFVIMIGAEKYTGDVQFYRYSMHASSASFVWVRNNGRIHECNASFCLLLGFTRPDLLDQDFMSIFENITSVQFSDLWSLRSSFIEVKVVRPDGKALILRIVPTQITCKTRELCLFHVTDVTHYDYLRGQMLMMENTLTHVSDAVLFIDGSGSIVYCNENAKKMTGYMDNSLMDGFPYVRLLHSSDNPIDVDRQWSQRVHMLEAQDGFLHSDVIIHKLDTTTVQVKTMSSFISVGNQKYVVEILRYPHDVVATGMIDSVITEQPSVSLKYLNGVLHQFTQPLQDLVNFVRPETIDVNGNEQQLFLKKICQRFNTAVEHLHLFYKVKNEAIVLNPTEFTIEQLRHSIFTALENEMNFTDYNGFSLEIDDFLQNSKLGFVADFKLLLYVLRVLLNNAVSYTSSGVIDLGISFISDQNEESLEGYGVLEFVVKDSGVGMSNDELRSLATFTESHDISSNTGSSGVSVFLAHHIVSMLKGTIAASSTQEDGSKFTVQIPVEVIRNTEAHQMGAGRLMEGLARSNEVFFIHVIHPTERVRKTIETICHEAGHCTSCFSSIKETIDMLMGSSFPFNVPETLKSDEGLDIRNLRHILLFHIRNVDEDKFSMQRITRYQPHDNQIPINGIILLKNETQSDEIANPVRNTLPTVIFSVPFSPSKIRLLPTVYEKAEEYVRSSHLNINLVLEAQQKCRAIFADDQTIPLHIRKYESMGIECHVVQDGQQLLEEITKRPPGFFNIAIVDLYMPVLTGIGAIKKIREWEQENNLESLAIICLTSSQKPVEYFKDVGFTSKLTKPAPISVIVENIEEYTGFEIITRRHEPIKEDEEVTMEAVEEPEMSLSL
ncbi:hypothetical protein PCE1_000892 [Barthelona sp. PCE]